MGAELGGPWTASVPWRPTLWVSPDGRAWHRLPFGPEDAVGAVRALAGLRGMLIAAGQNGPFMTEEGGPGEDAIWVNERPPAIEGQ